jgi:O-antigen ligase/tetratricopeptide (TPR) repeat protein
MKKNQKKYHQRQQAPQPSRPALYSEFGDALLALLLMAYVLAITFTPKWGTIDTNTARFYLLAILNLAGIVLIFALKKRLNGRILYFFSHRFTILYIALLLVSLISFARAINLPEAIINWLKTFTGLGTVLFIFIIAGLGRNVLKYFSIAMVVFLMVETMDVFVMMHDYLQGTVSSILDIKSVYGNKNIYSAALFVKLPFALWLFHFEKSRWRYLALPSIAAGATAILFLSARTFYLGLAFIFILYSVFLVYSYFRHTAKGQGVRWIAIAACYAVAFLVYTLVQQAFYANPEAKKGGGDNQYKVPVAERMATIASEQGSDRTNIWNYSWQVFKNNPVLGVGKGNWKLTVLEYENQKSPDFIYKYKVHNDFLETACETGFIGGLLMILLFAAVILGFWAKLFRDRLSGGYLQVWFLGAMGLSCYSVDAFFNFPSDRPEMFIYMGIFMGIALLAAPDKVEAEAVSGSSHSGRILPGRFLAAKLALPLMALVTLAGVYVFYLNYKSAKMQMVVYRLYKTKKLDRPADEVIRAFPPIPQITMLGEPIASNKAYCLMHEERYTDAIEVLRNDRSSPYDSRREHYMAMSFYKMENWDSALYYSRQAYQLKPLLLPNVGVMTTSLQRLGQSDEAITIINDYLAKQKTNPEGWILATELYSKAGDNEGASMLADTAMKYHKGNKRIRQTRDFYHHKAKFAQYRPLFEEALEKFAAKKFGECLSILNKFILNYNDYALAYERRAYCHYYLKNYRKSIQDATHAMRLQEMDYALVNLRGVCYHTLGVRDSACADFKKAMEKGKADGKINYEKFCVTRQQDK